MNRNEMQHDADTQMMKMYVLFAAMIAVAAAVMFGLMYLDVERIDHVFFSQARAYMALIMGAAMAVIMLAFMRRMYTNARANVAIVGVSVVAFILALWLVRSQATVGDVAYMKAMIPHHSIAILTSERARISDPRVRKLADEIIKSQRREIGEMKALISELESRRRGFGSRDLRPAISPEPQITELESQRYRVTVTTR